MPRTLGDALLAFYDRVEDPYSARWPREQVRRWLNEGCRELTKRTECLRDKTTVETPAGEDSFTLSENVVRILEVEWQPGTSPQRYPLTYSDKRAGRPIWGTQRMTTQAYPQFFYTEGWPGNLTVHPWPIPAENGTLHIDFNRFSFTLATNGADDDTPLDVPMGWEETVVSFAVYRAMLQAREPDAASTAREEFIDSATALADAAVRYVDEGGRIFMDDFYADQWY